MTSIALPWPPPKLMPNYKRAHHWSSYNKPARDARTLAWGLTAQEIGAKLRQWPCEDKLPIAITFTPPMRPGPVCDEDSAIGACKHYLDGIADALGLNDKQFSLAKPEWRDKEGGGSVVISWPAA